MNERMEFLVQELNKATKAYDEGNPYLSDEQWDDYYFELINLERDSGTTLPDSPTQIIDFQVVNGLEKIEHEHPMLSLDKTKDLNVIKAMMKDHACIAMLKMDGLTCSLTYENGELIRAETRGNGIVGENILHNARVIPSIPQKISYKDRLVVDGEIICRYDDFQQFSDEYKNPRNFASGSIRLLDSQECKNRKLTFVAWEAIEGLDYERVSDNLYELTHLGFTVVPFERRHFSEILMDMFNYRYSWEDLIDNLRRVATQEFYPIDGIVFKYDNIEYGQTLGATSHHARNAIALKFYDEQYPTTLIGIEWTMGRTTVLTPVAVFSPVDIEGSIIGRASLHNVNIMYETLGDIPHKGQKIKVFKANMIIPQIGWADKETHGPLYYEQYEPIEIPHECPVCGSSTLLCNGLLHCGNPDCRGALINRLDHFCGKKGLDIKGLSKATLEKLIDWDWIHNCTDLFRLYSHKDEWVQKPGFGEKSVSNILNAIEASKTCTLDKFICAVGIPLIGTSASKELCKYFEDWLDFRHYIFTNHNFYHIDGFGPEMNSALINFDYTDADYIYHNFMEIPKNDLTSTSGENLKGVNIVITGKLKNFKNRGELQALIESQGGKVIGSVSSNTHYLINNDTTSNSSKNLAAKKLNIPILSEEEFLEKFLTF